MRLGSLSSSWRGGRDVAVDAVGGCLATRPGLHVPRPATCAIELEEGDAKSETGVEVDLLGQLHPVVDEGANLVALLEWLDVRGRSNECLVRHLEPEVLPRDPFNRELELPVRGSEDAAS